MAKQNCWEVMKCGREPGGSKVGELGVCSAAFCTKADGLNGGKNGGRACWAIAGTFCKDEVQGSFASKYSTCKNCKFYNMVKEQEGARWQNAKVIMERLG